MNTQLIEARRRFALKYKISRRESDVLDLFLDGMTPDNVASNLELSINTIRNHTKSLTRKTQTNSIGQLLAKFIQELFE